ncbi:MAG: hypothetical protein HKN09_13575 [Saprospiraceae bacterium]|nr:hypothetical protein [Saprospiraceae bacterium]
MNRSLILIMIYCFGILGLVAQTSPASQMDGEQVVVSNNLNVDGSPLLYDDWEDATLVDVQGKKYENAQVNYDGLRSKFIAPHTSENNIIELNSFHYREVQIQDTGDRFLNGSPYGSLGFLRVIFEDDKFILFEKFSSIKRTKDKETYASVTAMYKIKNTKTLYVYTQDDGLVEVGRKYKDFESVFGVEGLKSFIKAEKLKLKNDPDLVRLMEYCSSRM